jgi:hypothetical protein
MRSASSSSVSTISTSMSRSPSPHKEFGGLNSRKPKSSNLSHSPPRQRLTDSEKKRRRESVSSVASFSSDDRRNYRRDSRERAGSRSTRRKFKQHSPPARGRRTESRSPQRDGRRRLSNDRQRLNDREKYRFNNDRPPLRDQFQENKAPRERSLSPFSKRIALTQAMNMAL